MLKLNENRLSDYEFTEDMIFVVVLKQRDKEDGYRLSYEETASYALLAYGKALNKAAVDGKGLDWTIESMAVKDSVQNHIKMLEKYKTD